MGIVYRAQDPAIGRIIAIKSIRLNEMTDPDERARLRERLFREAQSAGILSHPNIVTIYDILEEDGLAYIFMEFVNGKPLDDILRSNELPTGEQLIQLLTQTANALDYAHRKGIIHRDVKPANVMVHEDSIAKVCDFGIAKITSQSMTQTGVVMGTPSYMSPELIKGETLTGASDQFALAIMAYEILTGQKPFKADYLPTLFFKVCSDEPPAVHEVNPTLGPMVDRAVRKALAKKPEDRYATCTEFLKTLDRAIASSPDWTPLAKGPMPVTEDSTTGSGGRVASAVGTVPPSSAQEAGSRAPAGHNDATATSFSISSSSLTGDSWARASQSVPAPTPAPSAAAQISQQIPQPVVESPVVKTQPLPQPQAPAPTPPPASTQQVNESQRLPKTHQAVAPLPSHSASQSMRIPIREAEAASNTGGGASKVLIAAAAVAVLAIAGYFGYSKMSSSPETPPAATDPTATGQPTTVANKGAVATPAQVPAQPSQPTPNRPTTPPPTGQESTPGGKEVEVALTSTPVGATFVVDGGPNSCKTPCTMPLKPGRHSFQATLPGFVTMFRSIEVPQAKELSINLPEATGILSIVSTPKGASITIDGQARSEVTPARITLREGTHKIDLVLGNLRDSHEVTIRQGGIQQIQSTWQ
jgi:serine/threonine protein kinase